MKNSRSNNTVEILSSVIGDGLKLVGLYCTLRCAYNLLSYSSSSSSSSTHKHNPKFTKTITTLTQKHLLTSRSHASKYEIDYLSLNEVLKFWFANTPSQSNSKLWMIPNNRTLKRRRIDAEITRKFSNLVEDMSTHFDDFVAGVNDNSSSTTALYYKIAAVIALDQLSRHVSRYLNETEEYQMEVIDKIQPFKFSLNQKQLDQCSLELSETIHKHDHDAIKTGRVPLSMYVFILMPFRHENTIESVSFVQRCINERDMLEDEHCILLKRFRNATNRRLAVLQDINRREYPVSNKDNYWSDNDILEVHSFESDMKEANTHGLVITIENFLNARNLCTSTDTKSSYDLNAFPVIVSLSGGVDSMVIASVLAYLNRTKKFKLKIIAVHIDYANRPESEAEANYVMRYCEQMDIEFRCRVINEVTRGITARDEYEKIARIARYDMYKSVQEEFQDGGRKPPVLLGHHKGDLRENVLSNSLKGSGPLELSGMTEQGFVEKVWVWRPLLSLEKEAIFDYAHKYGVPFFKDTTPLWSTRGKLRKKLLPLLCEIYGEGSMQNLSNLAIQSDAARMLFRTSLKSFFDKVKTYPMGLIFDASEYKHHGLFFWRFALRQILHDHGRGMFTDKSVVSFIDRIKSYPLHRKGWLQCRKDYAIYLGANLRIFVFHPESFPFHKRDQYKCDGKLITIDGEPCRIGPWIIRATRHKSPTGTELSRKPFESMVTLMQGDFFYFVEVPVDRTFLDLVSGGESFSKASRPIAWKSIDPKIESSLPLVSRFPKDCIEYKDTVSIVKIYYKLGFKEKLFS